MKKNKLTLTAGILMVIVASFAILSAIDYASILLEVFQILLNGEMETISVVDAIYTLETMLLSLICIAEGVIYMVWGINLIKLTNKNTPIKSMRKLITVVTVISYVFAFIHLVVYMGTLLYFALLLTIAILLTCALNSKDIGGKSRKHNVENNDLIVKMQNLKKLKEENTISEEEYNVLRDKIISENIISKVDTQDK